jgi:hypothetical protein
MNRRGFERARLQPCRKNRNIDGASGTGGCILLLSKTLPLGLKPISIPVAFPGTAKAVSFQNNAFPLF